MINLIAEIGINYAFGEDRSLFLDNFKKLIDIAKFSGFDYVKFQKRNPDVSVPDIQKNKEKKVPWRCEPTTYLQYKKDIELTEEDCLEIHKYCESKDIKCFASVWDKDSVDFMRKLTNIMKIPSAMIHDIELVKYARSSCEILMISTGMSTQDEIDIAIKEGNPDIIFHTNSTYPSPIEELNLNYIKWLKEYYPTKQIGYSGHEFGLVTTWAAAALGVEWIERHITLDRTNWGSDQQCSIEPHGMIKLVKGVRDIEKALVGGYGHREVMDSEKSKRESLRGS